MSKEVIDNCARAAAALALVLAALCGAVDLPDLLFPSDDPSGQAIAFVDRATGKLIRVPACRDVAIEQE
jgi:hypothetical protein